MGCVYLQDEWEEGPEELDSERAASDRLEHRSDQEKVGSLGV